MRIVHPYLCTQICWEQHVAHWLPWSQVCRWVWARGYCKYDFVLDFQYKAITVKCVSVWRHGQWIHPGWPRAAPAHTLDWLRHWSVRKLSSHLITRHHALRCTGGSVDSASLWTLCVFVSWGCLIERSVSVILGCENYGEETGEWERHQTQTSGSFRADTGYWVWVQDDNTPAYDQMITCSEDHMSYV